MAPLGQDGHAPAPAQAAAAQAQAAQAPLLAGDAIGPSSQLRRYLVRDTLGAALYGTIFECSRAAEAGQGGAWSVAVKCISLARAERTIKAVAHRKMDDPWQEWRVAKLLLHGGGHPHVLQYVDAFVEADTMVLVSEFCAGGDLYELISARPNGVVPEREAVGILRQVAAGVQFLHAHNIAHRDLSLENVLLTADGTCKITDFGLSMPADQRSTEYAGKEYYMAPEVVAQVAYDPRVADVWSLGIMLFIMLTGSPLLPIAAPSSKGFASVARHGIAPILEAWGLRAQFSDALVDLLSRMLQVEPEQRLRVAGVLAHPALLG